MTQTYGYADQEIDLDLHLFDFAHHLVADGHRLNANRCSTKKLRIYASEVSGCFHKILNSDKKIKYDHILTDAYMNRDDLGTLDQILDDATKSITMRDYIASIVIHILFCEDKTIDPRVRQLFPRDFDKICEMKNNGCSTTSPTEKKLFAFLRMLTASVSKRFELCDYDISFSNLFEHINICNVGNKISSVEKFYEILIYACENNHFEIVDKILRYVIFLNTEMYEKCITIAVNRSHKEILKLLIENATECGSASQSYPQIKLYSRDEYSTDIIEILQYHDDIINIVRI